MRGFYEELEERKEELEKILETASASISTAPDGKVKVTSKGNRAQFYLYEEGESERISVGKYVRKENQTIIPALINKEYNQKVVWLAEKQIKAINTFLLRYPQKDVGDIYDNLGKHRKEYIDPYEIGDEEYARRWQEEENETKGFEIEQYDEEGELIYIPEIYSERGERVRSKSEKIIADKLYRNGIPYKYEKPLVLKGLGKIHPDFEILNKRTRKEYFLEHLGKMDDIGYVKKNMRRIDFYEKNGYLLGDRLLITRENRLQPFDGRVIDWYIEKYFQ